jgi:hypothetical protein
MSAQSENIQNAYESLHQSMQAHAFLKLSSACLKKGNQLQAWQALTNASLLLKDSQKKAQIAHKAKEQGSLIGALLSSANKSIQSGLIVLDALRNYILKHSCTSSSL